MACFNSGLEITVGFFLDFEAMEPRENFLKEPYDTSE